MSNLEIKSNDKVWYVTGSSRGVGLVTVQKLLKYGFKVVGTSRNKKQLIDAVGPLANSDNFLAVQVDLANEESVRASFNESLSKFGRIDVVVNNAGFGSMGALEETTDQDVRQIFDVNLFSVFNVIRNVTPILRNQKSGHVFNISSGAGIKGIIGHSAYCATKFALDGMSESYALEVKEFGIKVTSVNLGAFRTSLLEADNYKQSNRIDVYKQVHGVYDYIANQLNGKQRGDPSKIVDLLIRVYQSDGENTDHLFVGPDTNEDVSTKIRDFTRDKAKWEEYTTKTDFEEFADSSHL